MNTVQQALSDTFAREAGRILAALIGTVRDFELAEDALLVALERWPVDGIPGNPSAWITTIARHKARANNYGRVVRLHCDCPYDTF